MSTDRDPWPEIVERWRREVGSVRRGAAETTIAGFEQKYGVVLPLDVRTYFRSVDGTGDRTVDDLCYRFWSLAEVQPVEDVVAGELSFPGCFVFADHLAESWLYAVNLSMNLLHPAAVYRVLGENESSEPLAPSFKEFMKRYVADPESIL
jgi:hypothetical protein